MSDIRLNRSAIEAWASSADAKRVLDEWGKAVAEDARAGAPKDSGEGAESITHEVSEDADGAFVRISWDKPHFYLVFHELGTSKMPARPFLRPAAEKRRNL